MNWILEWRLIEFWNAIYLLLIALFSSSGNWFRFLFSNFSLPSLPCSLGCLVLSAGIIIIVIAKYSELRAVALGGSTPHRIIRLHYTSQCEIVCKRGWRRGNRTNQVSSSGWLVEQEGSWSGREQEVEFAEEKWVTLFVSMGAFNYLLQHPLWIFSSTNKCPPLVHVSGSQPDLVVIVFIMTNLWSFVNVIPEDPLWQTTIHFSIEIVVKKRDSTRIIIYSINNYKRVIDTRQAIHPLIH